MVSTQTALSLENLAKAPAQALAQAATSVPSSANLTQEGMQTALQSEAADLGVCPTLKNIRPQFDLHIFDTLSSTSTQLWDMLAQGYGAGTVVMATAQSSGRGQRGRLWQSPPGGLYLSLALEPDWPVTHAAQLTCLSAWGITTALNNLGLPIQIKWPNDLFFEGKKLGGILTETKVTPSPPSSQPSPGKSPGYIKQIVIGVGMNWHNPTPPTGVSLAKILKRFPESPASIKINCLEMLSALILRGILQGVCFQQQVGSQVFMKDYGKMLTQFGKAVSLDCEQLHQALRDGDLKTDLPPGNLSNCSGEVVGVSEEGYLKVALRAPPAESSYSGYSCLNSRDENILLLRPGSRLIKGHGNA